MFILVLSHFDNKIGPRVFLNVPDLPEDTFLDQIPHIMDFYDEGFFIHEFGDFRTSNLIFTIPNAENLRGGQESLMISILIMNDEETDPKSFQSLLNQFAHELTSIEEVYRIFYREDQKIKQNQEINKKVIDLVNSFYHSLPKETIFTKARELNLVMFEFFYIAPIAKEFISIGQFYKDISKDSDLLHSNLSLSRYSISRIMSLLNVNLDFLSFQLENKDGFVFLIDIAIKDMIQKAKYILSNILQLSEITSKPLVILLNQIDIDTFQKQNTQEDLNIVEDDNRIIRYISFNNYNNDDLSEIFTWMVDRIKIKKLKTIPNY